MAKSRISVAEDQFMCSVCLDVLMNPVTIPCGHSYCMTCITSHWNQQDRMGIYSCPQCRKTYTPRPALGKNVMIAEMVEKLKTEPQDAVPAGPGDVKCDVCTGWKNKAFKSCLVCLKSYCQIHFEKFHSERGHKVVDATQQLKQMICQKHNVFSRTDMKYICVLCVIDEHKDHETVLSAEEKTKMQGHLREIHKTVQQRIQNKEIKLQELKEAVKSHKRSAQAAVEDSEKIFSDLIRSIEKSRSEVTQLIRAQEQASVSRAQERLEQLKQEITDLKRNKAELEKLSDTDDHVRMLETFQSVSLFGSSKLPRIIISSDVSFDEVGKSVSKIKHKLNQYCRGVMDNISGTVKHIQIILGPDFETREEYLAYFHQFTLDPNTTNKSIMHQSDKIRTITSTHTDQLYPDHPDRFDSVIQVLCRESVSGRCYWEVDYNQCERFGVAVSYKNISRKGRGNECKFGHNNQSWMLLCSPPKYIFLHNNIKNKVMVASSSSKIGVYVDHGAGILSFYSVSDTMTLIHKVHTTFTQPLYPGFSLGNNAIVKLCNVKT